MDHHKTYRIDLNDYKERSRANMEAPKSTAAWILNSQDGPPSLEFKDDLPLSLLQPGEVLVKLHAASLNAREAMIAKARQHC